MSTYGIRNELYKDAAEQAYSLDPQKDLGDGFLLDEALSTPTLKFWKQTGSSAEQVQSTTEPGKVLVGIRGTQVTDWRDLSADSDIAIGKLDTSVRSRQDFIDMERAKAALSMFPFYGAGHSLGGALLDLFIRRGYIIGGRSYNGALELGKEEQTNHRIYNTQDALYNLSQPFLKQTPETYSTNNLFNTAKDASGLGSLFKYTIGGPTTYLIDTIRNQAPQILGAHNIKTVGSGMHGSGIADYIPDAVKNLIPTVDTNLANVTDKLFDFFGYGGFDAKSQEFLKQHGDENITSLVVRRAPIANMLHQAFNALTSGKWDESRHRYGYDDLFHIGIVINRTYIFEYLSHATIGPKSPDAPGSEFENVDGLGQGRTFTIKSLLETTINKVGKDKFFKYDTFTNNCQDHVLDILIANDLGKAPGLRSFIKQPVEQLLKDLPDYTQSAANTVTTGLTLLGAGKKRRRIPEHMSRGDYYQAGLNRHFRYT